MSQVAVLLVLLSAALHVTWNLRSRRLRTGPAFYGRASLAILPVVLPALLLWPGTGPQPVLFWALVAGTGLSQALYYLGLAGAYRLGDVGFAYPLARGFPVIAVPLVGLGLASQENLAGTDWAAMAAVAGGCALLMERGGPAGCLVWTLLAGAGTTAYTLIDATLLQLLAGAGASMPVATLVLLALQSSATALWMLPVVIRASEPSQWRSAALSGLLITGAYGLVLAAITQVDNVAFVSASRQISIPLGVLAGIVLLGEPPKLRRLLASGLIAGAAAVLALR